MHRVAVSGAAGRMGRQVVAAVHAAEDMELVAAVDCAHVGEDAGTVAGIGSVGVPIRDGLGDALADSGAQVVVDFTVPASAMANARTALERGVAPVIGTTGLAAKDLEEIRRLAGQAGVPALVAPNFALGAVLMMRFAEMAAAHLPNVEIVELHHEKKLDAPSGTALLTAARVAAARTEEPAGDPAGATEKISGVRGGESHGIRIHSVRLPGLVAHQEVLFGGHGETLSIRHDSLDRSCFMPGVLLAIRRIRGLTGLTVGLDSLL